LEKLVIKTPSIPMRLALTAHIRSILLSMALDLTSAVDGWLTVGPLAQSTLIAAAVLRRFAGKLHPK
jgi:hypothetical protein